MTELTQNRLKLFLSYNPIIGIFTRLTDRGGRLVGDRADTLMTIGYRRIMVDKKHYLAHRAAVLYMEGRWPLKEVDHINGDRADNRWVNLREATSSQNKSNARLRCDNKIGLKGVSAKRNKFRTQFRIGGKNTCVGYFDTPEEAHAAYLKLALIKYGQFANDGNECIGHRQAEQKAKHGR